MKLLFTDWQQGPTQAWDSLWVSPQAQESCPGQMESHLCMLHFLCSWETKAVSPPWVLFVIGLKCQRMWCSQGRPGTEPRLFHSLSYVRILHSSAYCSFSQDTCKLEYNCWSKIIGATLCNCWDCGVKEGNNKVLILL